MANRQDNASPPRAASRGEEDTVSDGLGRVSLHELLENAVYRRAPGDGSPFPCLPQNRERFRASLSDADSLFGDARIGSDVDQSSWLDDDDGDDSLHGQQESGVLSNTQGLPVPMKSVTVDASDANKAKHRSSSRGTNEELKVSGQPKETRAKEEPSGHSNEGAP